MQRQDVDKEEDGWGAKPFSVATKGVSVVEVELSEVKF
jgi:hypothetical protein